MSGYREKVVKEAERISKKEGLNELLDLGITNLTDLQKWLVRELYYEAKEKGDKSCVAIKNELCSEYAVSVSMIEKLIYRDLT
ncbi:MAG: hypothetical protein ACOYO1_19900 [Bacteroidales bacterium]